MCRALATLGSLPRALGCLNLRRSLRLSIYIYMYIQWECKGEMNLKYHFGKMKVECEGYDGPDDLYILRGSCRMDMNGLKR